MKKIQNKKYRIALDAMGGDFAPYNEIQGAIEAFHNQKPDFDLEIVFVGKETKIKSVMSQFDTNGMEYSIVNAEEIVQMNDDPTLALKKKKDSSLYKGLQLHSNGYVDAFISSGNTGAVLSHATVMLGRIKGVSRPTIGTFFPTENNYPSLLIDVGANIDSKPRFLYEFAVMGSIFLNHMMGIENPRIALINIGEEKSKGTAVIQETYKMLEQSNLNFIGNVEGRDLFLGSADVMVTDGFTGNVLLKFAESFPSFLKSTIKSFAKKSIFNRLIIALMIPILKKILKEFDYEEYGGVPLLGVNGTVLVGHGKSSPKAINSMISEAVEIIKKDVNSKIEYALNPPVITEKRS